MLIHYGTHAVEGGVQKGLEGQLQPPYVGRVSIPDTKYGGYACQLAGRKPPYVFLDTPSEMRNTYFNEGFGD